MKICYASLSYPSNGGAPSGVGSEIQFLAENLAPIGNSISVVQLTENGENDTIEERGTRIHRVSRGNLHWYVSRIPLLGKALALPIREVEYSLAAWRGIRRAGRVDLIEGTETGMLFAVMFRKQTPLVIRLHGEKFTFHKHTPGLTMSLDVRLSRMLQRLALRRATLLISPSQAHAREIAQELGLDHKAIRIIPNGVRLNEAKPKSVGPRDESTVLFVGRLERVKGVPLLLEAAQSVLSECPGARFVLAGGFHPSLSRLEIDSLIRSHSLEGKVQMLGHLPRAALNRLFRKATLCVVPSHYETFGILALEAMSLGMPVVGSRTGALPEVVEDGVTGLLFPSGDPQALAGAIVRLLSNPAERQRMGEAARDRVRIEFSTEKNIALNLGVYEELGCQVRGPASLKPVQNWN
jgi:glycosyltransferase involved in cell wall biosynthesis